MYRALTAEQAKAIELRAVSEAGASLAALMERAGAAVAHQVAEISDAGSILILAGPGNNGGDGWVAARLLAQAGREVRVIATRPPKELSGEAAAAASAAADSGVAFTLADKSEAALGEADVIVDALLGIGARLPLEEPIAGLCRAANASPSLRISVDMPTGVSSDTGAASPDSFRADVTVTFSAPKIGQLTYPGAAFCGEIVVADIGIPADYAEALAAPEVWTAEDYSAVLPVPAADAYKNSRGRVLVVAGSRSFAGAAILAARGAMRAGAGYVTLAVPKSIVHIAQAHLLAAPVVGLPAGRGGNCFSAGAGDAALELADDYDAVVLGPGMTLGDGAVVTSRRIFSHTRKPLAVDADALNALVDAEELLDIRHAPTVLTPHPGELSRLLRQPISEIQSDRLAASAWLAQGQRAVVLKGAGTVVSGAGRQTIIAAGSPALATAGTGDVLAGVIGTLLAQGLEPFNAGALGAYLHARAGEEAAASRTPVGVIADDVPEHLPEVFADLLGSW
jgi:NAD(P)H-hydrate epimerase